jgi:hypothetical protein
LYATEELKMIQFPTKDKEFNELFKTEEDCMAYIMAVRWPLMGQGVQNVSATSFGAKTRAVY